MTITLTDTEARICAWLGEMRHKAARLAGVVDRKQGPQNAIATDVEGIGGELAFCKACGAWPDLTVGARSGGHDAVVCGILFDVKTTNRPSGRMLATLGKSVNEVDAYALVCGTMPTYRIAGWCWSQELIVDANVIDLGHGPGYGLTQDKLRPFALLASMLGIQTQQARRRVGT